MQMQRCEECAPESELVIAALRPQALRALVVCRQHSLDSLLLSKGHSATDSSTSGAVTQGHDHCEKVCIT